MKQLTTALLLLLALAAGSVTAAPGWPASRFQLAERASGISLDQAAERVRQQTGGRILSAETITRNGQRIHRIKVLTPDHRVVIREIYADGR